MRPVYIVRLGFLSQELEEEFNRWYDNIHLSDLLKVPHLISARRFTPIHKGEKYLAIYEFTDVDGMIKGKNSSEMANCRADTRARWNMHLDPNGERYWCKIHKVFKGFKISNSPTLFLTLEPLNDYAQKFMEEEVVGNLLKLQEIKNAIAYEPIFKEPENLPNKILLCQFQNRKIQPTIQKMTEILQSMKSKEELRMKLNYAFYNFRIAITKTFR